MARTLRAGRTLILIERGDNATIGLVILSAAAGAAVFHDLDGEGSDSYEGGMATPDQIIVAGHYNDGTFGYSAIDVYELGLFTRGPERRSRGPRCRTISRTSMGSSHG